MKLKEIEAKVQHYAEEQNAIAYPVWMMIAGINRVVSVLEGYMPRRITIKVPAVKISPPKLSVVHKYLPKVGVEWADIVRDTGVCPDCGESPVCVETFFFPVSSFVVQCECEKCEVSGFDPPIAGVEKGKPFTLVLAEQEVQLAPFAKAGNS